MLRQNAKLSTMDKIKFWEEQLPNGMINQSSNRLIFLAGWVYIFALCGFEEIMSKLYDKPINYELIILLASYVTGQKMYQKHVEAKSITKETPVKEGEDCK